VPGKQDAPYESLKWVEISDFTPGVITNSGMVAPTNTNTARVPGKIPGQAAGAQGCIALPNGGLAPGPGLLTTAPWGATLPIAPVHTPNGGANADITTFLGLAGPLSYYAAGSPYALTQGDELLIGQAKVASGTLSWWLDSIQIHPATTAINNVITATPATQVLPFCTTTGALTRAINSATLLGFPIWVLSHWFTGTGSPSEPLPGTFYNRTYPDPTAAGLGFGTLNITSSWPAECLAHQNRMVFLKYSPFNYSNTDTYLSANETFYYTDPPNDVTLIAGVGEIFVQEDPSGYGAWGSQSASELFLVKNYGGGVVISGDLNAPTVTRLPGVEPCYGLMSRAASTPIGLVYASNNRGLWLWNGGNASQKLSPQLDDNFFVVTGGVALPPTLRGPRVDIQRWGDWIIVSNDWLYDTNTNSWWQLYPGLYGAHTWYQSSSDGSNLYAALGVPQAACSVEMYSRTAPSTIYNWSSYPIRIPANDLNHNAIIREVVVRASGAGTIQVNLHGVGFSHITASPSTTLTFTSTVQPVEQRMAVGHSGGGPFIAQDITLDLFVASGTTSPAPIVYSVAIGYEESSALVSAT